MSFRKTLFGCIPTRSSQKEKNMKDKRENKQKNCMNSFVKTLSQELLPSDDVNTVYSPYSIVSVLCMALAGAKGKTFAEMKKTIHLEDKLQVLAAVEQLSAILGNLMEEKGDALFINKSKALFEHQLKIKSTYVDLLTSKFQSEIAQCDFKHNDLSVNEWIGEATNLKITDLMLPDTLEGRRGAVLLNALYFKADWLSEFEEGKTMTMPFHLQSGGAIQETAFMNEEMNTEYGVFSDLKCSAIRLKLKNSQFKVMFVLPNERNGLPDLVNALFVDKSSDANFAHLLKKENFMNKTLDISLPKFKIKKRLGLKETLRSLGMTSAFQAEGELDGITESEQLFIDEVLHMALFEIDEKGAEAASISAAAMMKFESTHPSFRADHPFLFAVLSANDTVLLFGRMSHPEP